MARKPHNADVIAELRAVVNDVYQWHLGDPDAFFDWDVWIEKADSVLAKTARFEQTE